MVENEKAICGAKLRKKAGRFCHRKPLKGKKRCRLHGGKSLSGVSSPKFKHGRYSKVLPRGLRKRFEEAGRDPFLFSNKPELKLLDVKLSELVAELGQASGPDLLGELKKVWKEFQEAQIAKDEAKIATCVSTIDKLLKGAVYGEELWRQILEYIEARRKLLESESKRMKDQQQMISIEEILVHSRYISESIRTACLNHASPLVARRILADFLEDLQQTLSQHTHPTRPLV